MKFVTYVSCWKKCRHRRAGNESYLKKENCLTNFCLEFSGILINDWQAVKTAVDIHVIARAL
jgi:hypothetical protein